MSSAACRSPFFRNMPYRVDLGSGTTAARAPIWGRPVISSTERLREPGPCSSLLTLEHGPELQLV